MHKAMAKTIVRAKVFFFDKTPSGRVLTRFSKEMAVLDYILPSAVSLAAYGFFRVISVTISLSIVNVWLLIPIFFIILYQVYVLKRASRPMIEA